MTKFWNLPELLSHLLSDEVPDKTEALGEWLRSSTSTVLVHGGAWEVVGLWS